MLSFVSMIISLIATGIVMFIIGVIFAQNLWSWKRNCFFFLNENLYFDRFLVPVDLIKDLDFLEK